MYHVDEMVNQTTYWTKCRSMCMKETQACCMAKVNRISFVMLVAVSVVMLWLVLIAVFTIWFCKTVEDANELIFAIHSIKSTLILHFQIIITNTLLNDMASWEKSQTYFGIIGFVWATWKFIRIKRQMKGISGRQKTWTGGKRRCQKNWQIRTFITVKRWIKPEIRPTTKSIQRRPPK